MLSHFVVVGGAVPTRGRADAWYINRDTLWDQRAFLGIASAIYTTVNLWPRRGVSRAWTKLPVRRGDMAGEVSSLRGKGMKRAIIACVPIQFPLLFAAFLVQLVNRERFE